MPAPRVIFVNRVYQPDSAATAQLLTDLAEGLAGRGWNVQVIASGEVSETQSGVSIRRTGPAQSHGSLRSRLRDYWHFIREARKELKRIVQPGDVVVAMTDPPLLGAALGRLARRRGALVVHWVQDVYPEIASQHMSAMSAFLLGPLRIRRNAAWRSARSCVVLGETMARLVASHNVPTARITTIPNWAPRELHAVPAESDIAAQREKWGLTGRFIVAYSGNLGRVHEFTALIGAADILRAHADIVFLFIGSGPRLAEVRAAVEEKQLSNVRVLPPVPRENLAVSLAAADVHCVTLRPDFASLVYPSKLAGALAAGRPVLFVGPTGGEIARLLAAKSCGATVPPQGAKEIAALLELWHDDRSQRSFLGRNARTTYEKYFAWGPALARWEEVLRRAPLADRVPTPWLEDNGSPSSVT